VVTYAPRVDPQTQPLRAGPYRGWPVPLFITLPLFAVAVRLGPVLAGPALCVSALRGVPLLFVVCVGGVCVGGGGGGGGRGTTTTGGGGGSGKKNCTS